MISSESMWDAKDVATFLKVSRSWVYMKANANELPHRRVGGMLRFEPESIRAWVRGDAPAEARVIALGRVR